MRPFVKVPPGWGHGQATELRKGKRRRPRRQYPSSRDILRCRETLLAQSFDSRTPVSGACRTLMCCLRAACRNLRRVSRACGDLVCGADRAHGSGEVCSVEVAKKIAKNKRCYANTLRPRSRMLLKVMKGG